MNKCYRYDNEGEMNKMEFEKKKKRMKNLGVVCSQVILGGRHTNKIVWWKERNVEISDDIYRLLHIRNGDTLEFMRRDSLKKIRRKIKKLIKTLEDKNT